MLDIHRSASKQIEIDLSLTDILQDILEPVASILFLRGAAVNVQVECRENLVCQTDRMRLKQIVLNLASNATKFVEQGYIRLRAESVNGNVEVSVEDSGPGIPLEKRHRLFAKFQESLDSLNQGTGIGLAVCKNLSDLMGVDLWLDETFQSGVDGCLGTRFVMRLNKPALSIEQSFEGVKSDEEEKRDLLSNVTTINHGNQQTELPDNLSVLFVDDDTILRKMFSRSLKRVAPNWNVEEACNGETALRLTESTDFKIIFMDQYMASIDKQRLGTETVLAMRSQGVKSIICGLSANDMEQQFLRAGANCFMFKPFPCEAEALSAELLRVLAAGEEKAGPISLQVPKSPSRPAVCASV